MAGANQFPNYPLLQYTTTHKILFIPSLPLPVKKKKKNFPSLEKGCRAVAVVKVELPARVVHVQLDRLTGVRRASEFIEVVFTSPRMHLDSKPGQRPFKFSPTPGHCCCVCLVHENG